VEDNVVGYVKGEEVNKQSLVIPFGLSIVFTIYNEIKQKNTIHGLPYPKAFLFPLIVYGGLAIFASSETLETPAVLVGWGFVIAQILFGLSSGKATLPFQKAKEAKSVNNVNPLGLL
jgi:hypothetical protein